jgi:hypothetical protein
MPSRPSAAPPPRSFRAEPSKILFSLIEKSFRGRVQIQNCKEYFARRRASASGGGAGQFSRSKKVRVFSNKGHQTGLPDFLEAKAIVCSPRLRARLARNEAAKSYGGTKSQDAIFSEMRRFVITKLCIKMNFYSNLLRKISRFAGLRRFFIPSPNISYAKI